MGQQKGTYSVHVFRPVMHLTSVDEYSKIVTVQQLGDRIMYIMHMSRLKYNS